MSMRKFYECDPKKNVNCKKSICKYNPLVPEGSCHMTTCKEFRRTGIIHFFTKLFKRYRL
jgi:hypothetical protein